MLFLIPAALAAVSVLLCTGVPRAQDAAPLPSWNEGPAKRAVLGFVRTVTDNAGANYAPPEERIAAFDQDGTLWVEHPVDTQAMFALDCIRLLAPQHPEWKNKQPFKAVIASDRGALAKFGEADWAAIVAATHAGVSNEEFLGLVQQWLETARDPRWKRPYMELVYQPMPGGSHRGNSGGTYAVYI